MQPVVERFTQTYGQLSARSLGLLSDLYSDDIEFQDPFHRIAGLPALRQYLAALYAHVESCSFKFEEGVTQGNESVLMWSMFLKHPRLNGGAVVTVPGSTHIRFRDKVSYHRDYFDAGAMLYEQLPLIGRVIRIIKRRV
ncbi:MAG TPA: nuclear transport factor 2 family protein [Nitrospira sp.]|nr:nuclear transport factor 2 family protein [Nitrospira sp.]